MPRPRPVAALLAWLVVLASLRAQQPAASSPPPVDPAITGAAFVVGEAELFGHVQFLASPELAGRKSGSSEGAADVRREGEGGPSLGWARDARQVTPRGPGGPQDGGRTPSPQGTATG